MSHCWGVAGSENNVPVMRCSACGLTASGDWAVNNAPPCPGPAGNTPTQEGAQTSELGPGTPGPAPETAGLEAAGGDGPVSTGPHMPEPVRRAALAVANAVQAELGTRHGRTALYWAVIATAAAHAKGDT